MVEQSHAITPTEPVATSQWRYAQRSNLGIERPLDCLCCDLSDALWLDVIIEQVGNHQAGVGRWRAVQQKPLPTENHVRRRR
jgi:hypothetical protein